MADFATNIEGCKRIYKLGSEDKYVIVFSSANCVSYPIGTSFNGYYLAGNYTPSFNTNTGGYDYNMEFVAKWCMMKNHILKYDNNGVKETSFSVTLKLSDHIALVAGNGLISVVGTNLPTTDERKCISYSSTSILDAVVAIAEAYELDWWGDGDKLYIGTYQNGQGGSTDISSMVESVSGDSNSDFATGIYVFGGTKNLPSNYRNSGTGGINTSVVERHLHMPSSKGDSLGNVGSVGCVEKVVVFDDIYPKTNQTVQGVGSYTAVYDNTAFSVGSYVFTPSEFVFNNESSRQISIKSDDGLLDVADLDDGGEFVIEGKTFKVDDIAVKIGEYWYKIDAYANKLTLDCYSDESCTTPHQYSGTLKLNTIKYGGNSYSAIASGDDSAKVSEKFYVLYYPETFEINNSYRLNGKAFEVTFNKGSLNGMTFEANWHGKGEILGDQSDSIILQRPCFEIIANTNYGIKLPNDTLKPVTGDTFFIDGWDATKLGSGSMIATAEAALQAAGEAYFASICNEAYSCQVTLKSGQSLALGSSVKVNGIKGYVIGYELDLATNDIKSPIYYIGKTSQYTRFGSLSNDVTNVHIESASIDSDLQEQINSLSNSVNYSIQNQGQYAKLKWVKDLINFVVGEDVYKNGNLVKTESGLALTKNTTRLYSLSGSNGIVNEAYVQTKVNSNGKTELNMRADQVTINTTSYSNKTLDEVVESLNGGIQKGDSEFVIWKAEYQAPVDASGVVLTTFGSSLKSPSKDWSESEIVSHEGDFVVTTDGYVYKLTLTSGVYSWDIITDKYLTQAIKEATDAKVVANNAKDKLDGMASDSKITYIEWNQVNGLAYIWQETQQEYAEIVSKMTNNMSGYLDYVNAYNALRSEMESIYAHFVTNSYRTDYSITGSTFTGLWNTYYTKRTVAQQSIQTAIDNGISGAQNTANAAVKVFSQNTLPTPPYKLGDHWVAGSYTASDNTPYTNEEFYCINAKTSDGTAAFSDWAILVNGARLNTTKDAIKASVEKDLTSTGILVMDKDVKIYVKEGQEPVSLFNVTDTSITLNSQIVAIDGTNISFNGKILEMSASNDFTIKSPFIEFSKDGGRIGLLHIDNNGLVAKTDIKDESGNVIASDNLSYRNDFLTSHYSEYKNVAEEGEEPRYEYVYRYNKWAIENDGDAYFGAVPQYDENGYNKLLRNDEGEVIGWETKNAVHFKKDGSGSLAFGNIEWSANGDLTAKGDIKAKGLYVKNEGGEYVNILTGIAGSTEKPISVDSDGNLNIHGKVYASGGEFNGDVVVKSLRHSIYKITRNDASQVINDLATYDSYIGDGNGHTFSLDHADQYTGMELTFIDNININTVSEYKGLYVKVSTGDHIYCSNKDHITGDVTNYAATEILVYNNVVKLMSDGRDWIMIYCQDNTEVVVTAS